MQRRFGHLQKVPVQDDQAVRVSQSSRGTVLVLINTHTLKEDLKFCSHRRASFLVSKLSDTSLSVTRSAMQGRRDGCTAATVSSDVTDM